MAFSIDGAAAVVENQAVFTFLSPLKESGFKSPLAAEERRMESALPLPKVCADAWSYLSGGRVEVDSVGPCTGSGTGNGARAARRTHHSDAAGGDVRGNARRAAGKARRAGREGQTVPLPLLSKNAEAKGYRVDRGE